ncbi:MAG: peptide-methionine (S)-S-oxide reductase MsrA [Gammaproteobacteria bacterium]|nr:peptide-methionine (S)-S-oxide reductase MsrA [Gammaproteobacteria bacterium]
MKSRSLLAVLALSASLLMAAAIAGEYAAKNKAQAVATFAGGCFWCMEPPYDKTEGVISTISGYMGGHVVNPSYEQVSSGKSGHIEVVQVTYHPDIVSYEELLEIFWMNIDPTDDRGQFCDKGPQYRSAIFFHDESQRNKAIESKQTLQKNKPFKESIATEILEASEFYPAEEYHQDYYTKNPLRYKYYRFACGRDKRLEAVWG